VRRPGSLTLVFAAATLLAGCGSSASEDPTAAAGAAQSDGADAKQAFITRADALCEASRAKQEPLRREVAAVARQARAEEGEGELTDATRQRLAQLLDRVVAMAEASQARIEALDWPEADAAQLEEILVRTEAAFDASRAYGAALRRHEDAAAQALAERANVQTGEIASLAAQYGFEACGSQP
jgi:hypothetical protein